MFGSKIGLKVYRSLFLTDSDKKVISIKKICIFAASYAKPYAWVEGKRDILNGVYLTLCSRRVETYQISVKLENAATVDAYGIFLWTALAVL